MRASNEMPTFDALFEPLLAALLALGGSGSIEEIYAKTVEVAGISEDVASQMHDPDKSNMTEVGYRLAWARTYLRKYGLLENSSRGVWSLTAKGNSANKINTAEIVKAVPTWIGQSKTSGPKKPNPLNWILEKTCQKKTAGKTSSTQCSPSNSVRKVLNDWCNASCANRALWGWIPRGFLA